MVKGLVAGVMVTASVTASSIGVSQEANTAVSTAENSELPPYVKREDRAYHFGIGVGKPLSIGNEYNHYDIMFNSPSVFPQLWGEYYFLSFMGFDLGVRTKIAYYTDTGNPARAIKKDEIPLKRDLEESEIARDQRSTLSLIPIQLSVSLNFSPFKKRYLSVQAWYGLQVTYVQNSMGGVDEAAVDKAKADDEALTYLNNGYNKEMVFGLALPIKVSQFNANTNHSLRVFGIDGLYITPFLEMVTTIQDQAGVFDRSVAGMMITVDTSR